MFRKLRCGTECRCHHFTDHTICPVCLLQVRFDGQKVFRYLVSPGALRSLLCISTMRSAVTKLNLCGMIAESLCMDLTQMTWSGEGSAARPRVPSDAPRNDGITHDLDIRARLRCKTSQVCPIPHSTHRSLCCRMRVPSQLLLFLFAILTAVGASAIPKRGKYPSSISNSSFELTLPPLTVFAPSSLGLREGFR